MRTYAPRGHTPVLRVPLTRDHLSVISGITSEGTLLSALQERAFDGAGQVRFLRQVRRSLGGPRVVIWDGGL